MSEKINSYKDLEIWKKSIILVTDIYSLTQNFPKEEIYGLINQMRRASSSLPANIAEGWGREGTKSFIYFLRNAKGSLYELETFLIISNNLKYIDNNNLSEFTTKTQELSKMLNSLINKLELKLFDNKPEV